MFHANGGRAAAAGALRGADAGPAAAVAAVRGARRGLRGGGGAAGDVRGTGVRGVPLRRGGSALHDGAVVRRAGGADGGETTGPGRPGARLPLRRGALRGARPGERGRARRRGARVPGRGAAPLGPRPRRRGGGLAALSAPERAGAAEAVHAVRTLHPGARVHHPGLLRGHGRRGRPRGREAPVPGPAGGRAVLRARADGGVVLDAGLAVRALLSDSAGPLRGARGGPRADPAAPGPAGPAEELRANRALHHGRGVVPGLLRRRLPRGLHVRGRGGAERLRRARALRVSFCRRLLSAVCAASRRRRPRRRPAALGGRRGPVLAARARLGSVVRLRHLCALRGCGAATLCPHSARPILRLRGLLRFRSAPAARLLLSAPAPRQVPLHGPAQVRPERGHRRQHPHPQRGPRLARPPLALRRPRLCPRGPLRRGPTFAASRLRVGSLRVLRSCLRVEFRQLCLSGRAGSLRGLF